MIGIRDTSDQAWSVAVVRWIRQVRNGAMQMGIELVAPMPSLAGCNWSGKKMSTVTTCAGCYSRDQRH